MTCREVDQLLSEGRPAAELQRLPGVPPHLETCVRCRRILEWMLTPSPEPEMRASLAERVQAITHTDLKKVKPLPPLGVAALGAVAVTALVAALHVLTLGVDGWTRLSATQAGLMGGLALAVLLSAAASLLSSIRPGSAQGLPPGLPLALLVMGFPMLAAVLFPFEEWSRVLEHGIECLAAGLMVAAMTTGLTWLAARRGYSVDWSRSGALIGAVGGAAAIFALQVSCPAHEAGHLIVWHGLAAVIAIGGGYLAGRRMNS
jgi:hypothetical protein